MASRRDQIRMSAGELDAFLAGRHTMNVATLGPSGHPHLVAMWYGFFEGKPAFFTFAKSQKILNLQRDARVTALVEDGEQYAELRGAELVGTGEIVTDPESVMAIAVNVAERYTGPVTDETRPFLEKQAAKRFGVVLHIERVVTWDHTKLAGGY